MSDTLQPFGSTTWQTRHRISAGGTRDSLVRTSIDRRRPNVGRGRTGWFFTPRSRQRIPARSGTHHPQRLVSQPAVEDPGARARGVGLLSHAPHSLSGSRTGRLRYLRMAQKPGHRPFSGTDHSIVQSDRGHLSGARHRSLTVRSRRRGGDEHDDARARWLRGERPDNCASWRAWVSIRPGMVSISPAVPCSARSSIRPCIRPSAGMPTPHHRHRWQAQSSPWLNLDRWTPPKCIYDSEADVLEWLAGTVRARPTATAS